MSTEGTPDIRSLLKNGFTEETAEALYAQGKAVVIFALLQLAALAAQSIVINGQHPSTPSANVPPFQKENKQKGKNKGKGKGKGKKPGGKPGHKGHRRPPPEITHRLEHRETHCPDCGTKLNKRNNTRKRLIEDIPASITPEVTEHTIHRDYCPKCKKTVAPVVPDAMPNAQIGIRTVVLTAFLHYLIGTTISQIIGIFNAVFYFKLTPGGLVHLWHNLALVLFLWYEEIGNAARTSAVLHGDETGWRVNGQTYWLWCFTNQDVTYYVIDRSRASPVVLRFLKQAFKGVLVTDFYGAYNAVVCAAKQKCLAHLLRDLKQVTKYKDTSGDWETFSKRLKRLLRDAMRLRGRWKQMPVEEYESLRSRIEKRMTSLLESSWSNVEAKRLVKRLRRHREELFVFLYNTEVPSDNNHAERVIRNGVVMRKNSYCNRSVRGAETQAVLMSVFQTLKQRGFQGTDTVVEALRQYLTTKKLPKLPQKIQTAE